MMFAYNLYVLLQKMSLHWKKNGSEIKELINKMKIFVDVSVDLLFVTSLFNSLVCLFMSHDQTNQLKCRTEFGEQINDHSRTALQMQNTSE